MYSKSDFSSFHLFKKKNLSSFTFHSSFSPHLETLQGLHKQVYSLWPLEAQEAVKIKRKGTTRPRRLHGSQWTLTTFTHGALVRVFHLECQADLAGHQFLHGGQHDWVADLLPLAVPLYLPIQCWRLPGLSVSIVRAHCINLRNSTEPTTQKTSQSRWNISFVYSLPIW